MPRNPDGSEGSPVGEIKKKWSGILKEMLTDADNFGMCAGVVMRPRCVSIVSVMCYVDGNPHRVFNAMSSVL